jgi:hypothetical protein
MHKNQSFDRLLLRTLRRYIRDYYRNKFGKRVLVERKGCCIIIGAWKPGEDGPGVTGRVVLDGGTLTTGYCHHEVGQILLADPNCFARLDDFLASWRPGYPYDDDAYDSDWRKYLGHFCMRDPDSVIDRTGERCLDYLAK